MGEDMDHEEADAGIGANEPAAEPTIQYENESEYVIVLITTEDQLT
jgi:hypothetical protein